MTLVPCIKMHALRMLLIIAGLSVPGAALWATPPGAAPSRVVPDAAAGSLPDKASPAQSVMGSSTPAPPSLDQLREIHLPAEVGIWPPAPGWWFAIALLLMIGGWLCWWLWRYWRSNRYRKQARRMLLDHRKRCPGAEHRTTYLTGVNDILRRTALVAFPRQQVAALTGDAWVSFLARSSGLDAFRHGEGQILAVGPYAPEPQFDADRLQALALRWVRRHSRRRLKRSTVSNVDTRSQAPAAVKHRSSLPTIIGSELAESQQPKAVNGVRSSSEGSAC